MARLSAASTCRQRPGCAGPATPIILLLGRRRRTGRPGLAVGQEDRQGHCKLTPLAQTLAECLHGAAVQLGQPRHQGQADTQPTLGPNPAHVFLHKQVEYLGEQFRRDAYARVTRADEHVLSTLDRQAGVPSGSVNLMALFSRLATICWSRIGSASSLTEPGGKEA